MSDSIHYNRLGKNRNCVYDWNIIFRSWMRAIYVYGLVNKKLMWHFQGMEITSSEKLAIGLGFMKKGLQSLAEDLNH